MRAFEFLDHLVEDQFELLFYIILEEVGDYGDVFTHYFGQLSHFLGFSLFEEFYSQSQLLFQLLLLIGDLGMPGRRCLMA